MPKITTSTTTSLAKSIKANDTTNETLGLATTSLSGFPTSTINVNGFTVSFWVKLDGSSSDVRHVYHDDTRSGVHGGVWFQTANQLYFRAVNSGGAYGRYWSIDIADYQEWVHVAITWDGDMNNGDTELFVNGVSQGAGTNALGTGSGTTQAITDLYIYDKQGVLDGFELKGALVDFAMWSKEYTSSQIQNIYNGGIYNDYSEMGGVYTPNLILWYRLGEESTISSLTTGDSLSAGTQFAAAHTRSGVSGATLTAQSNIDMEIVEGPYQVTTTTTTTFSGITSDTPRRTLRAKDAVSGQYPTIARTGDSSRMGNFNINFDDRNTIVFEENTTLLEYPHLGLYQSSHPLLKSNASAHSTTNSGVIVTTGSLVKGISDDYLLKGDRVLIGSRLENDLIANGEALSGSVNITPFDESRINLGTSTFYMTGTAEDVYPGFSSRLHDKTQIVIDMTANETTYFGNTNKSNDSSSPYLYQSDTSDVKQPYMGYYNHILKRWESIGQGFGMNQTYGTESNLIDIVKKAQIGFDGCIAKIATGSDQTGNDYRLFNNDTLNSTMRPISTFGFPFDGRYHATGSQIIDMSQYINAPFVVEKVVFEFNALIETGDSPGTGDTDTNGYRLGAGYGDPSGIGNSTDSIFTNVEIRNYNFFLLRQFESKFEKSWEIITGSGSPTNESGFRYGKFTVTSSIPGTFGLGGDSSTITLVKDERELITYGQLIDYHVDASNPLTNGSGFTKQDVLNSPLIAGRDAIFERETASFGQTSGSSLTGSFIVPCNVRHTAGILPANRMRVYTTKGTVTELALWMQNRYSSRGRDTLDKSSRALVNGHGSVYKGVTERLQPFSSTEEAFPITPSAAETLDDHSPYVLFPQDKIIIGFQYPPPENLKTAGGVFDDVRLNRMGFNGPGKITLYGSQIKENKEFHDTLNQNLTTLGVHEAIHYDNPTLDQFLVATEAEYSGSYMDTYVKGGIGSVARSIVGTGGNEISGSLQRFRGFDNRQQRYYDSVLIDIESMFKADGYKMLDGTAIGLSDPRIRLGSITTVSSGEFVHNSWHAIFPFEPRYHNSAKKISQKIYLYHVGAENDSTGNLFNRSNFSFLGTDVTTDADLEKRFFNSSFAAFSFGSGQRNMFKFVNGTTRLHRPKGFKYGIINALPQFTKNIYRGDKFGQRADMLEQAQDSRFLVGSSFTSDGPLRIRFVLDDDDNDQYVYLNENEIINNTYESSNLSIYATSSLPFFDDETPRNRDYDNISLPSSILEVVST